MTTGYQPKTGQKCSCKRGVERDNCPRCEGTGWAIDFAAIRARTTATTYGTCYFVSREAAIRYYAEYEKDPQRAVDIKLSEGSICIGRPALKPGQKLTVIDDGTRYAVTEEKP